MPWTAVIPWTCSLLFPLVACPVCTSFLDFKPQVTPNKQLFSWVSDVIIQQPIHCKQQQIPRCNLKQHGLCLCPIPCQHSHTMQAIWIICPSSTPRGCMHMWAVCIPTLPYCTVRISTLAPVYISGEAVHKTHAWPLVGPCWFIELKLASLLQELEPQLKKIKAAKAKGARDLLVHIKQSHPPKFKSNLAEPAYDNIRQALRKASAEYHPDKQSRYDQKWQVLSGRSAKLWTMSGQTIVAEDAGLILKTWDWTRTTWDSKNWRNKKGKRQGNAVRWFSIEKLEMIPSWAKASLAFQPFQWKVREASAEFESAYSHVSNCMKSTTPLLLPAKTML